jgi:GT2 family glycosyltransferase
MGAREQFAVVVVTHNSADHLLRLTESLRRYLSERFQLVVVDNASTDESVEVARSMGAEVVLLSENRGFGAGNNLGIARVRRPVTVLLNPDVELRDDGLLRLVEQAAAQRALIAPRLLAVDGRVQDSAHPVPGRPGALWFGAFGPALPRAMRLRAQPWRSPRRAPVGWVIAAALAAQTDLLRALGPFNPDAFLFYEDLDLCLRARELGVPTMLEPSVVLVHRGGHSTSAVYSEEPHQRLAERRRQVIEARLGRRALLLDDLSEGLTFATRAAARRALGRPAERPRAQLAALLAARRSGRSARSRRRA